MKLEIYKSINTYCGAEVIRYAIRDADLPPSMPCITIRVQDADWSLYTQAWPEMSKTGLAPEGGFPDYEESSFLDLLVTTGLLESQIEYIFTNLDFDSHTISIQPRSSISKIGSFTSTYNTSGSANPIVINSSFGHAQPVQTRSNMPSKNV